MSFEEMGLEEFLAKYGSVAKSRLERDARSARFKKKAKLRSKTDWETALFEQICDEGLPKPLREVGFHPHRKWRFDFAWPERLIAVEVEGGIFGQVVTCNHCGKQVLQRLKNGGFVKVRTGGRHNRGKSYERDCEKYNSAAILGWTVIRVTSNQIKEGQAIEWIRQILDSRPPERAQ